MWRMVQRMVCHWLCQLLQDQAIECRPCQHTSSYQPYGLLPAHAHGLQIAAGI